MKPAIIPGLELALLGVGNGIDDWGPLLCFTF